MHFSRMKAECEPGDRDTLRAGLKWGHLSGWMPGGGAVQWSGPGGVLEIPF